MSLIGFNRFHIVSNSSDCLANAHINEFNIFYTQEKQQEIWELMNIEMIIILKKVWASSIIMAF